jgi:hypothetical protein
VQRENPRQIARDATRSVESAESPGFSDPEITQAEWDGLNRSVRKLKTLRSYEATTNQRPDNHGLLIPDLILPARRAGKDHFGFLRRVHVTNAK